MQCRHCGTEIADQALVCYRCGTATAEPKFKAPASRQPRSAISLVASTLALGLLILLALYAERVVTVGASRTLSWAIVALAVVIVVLRGVARRARR